MRISSENHEHEMREGERKEKREKGKERKKRERKREDPRTGDFSSPVGSCKNFLSNNRSIKTLGTSAELALGFKSYSLHSLSLGSFFVLSLVSLSLSLSLAVHFVPAESSGSMLHSLCWALLLILSLY